MASIDINKLIQESMGTAMAKTENIEETTVPGTNVDDNMNTLHDSMKTVIIEGARENAKMHITNKKTNDDIEAADKASNNAARSLASTSKMASQDSAIADAKRNFSLTGKVYNMAKKVGGGIKDYAQDHPGVAGAAAAGAAGLVGAGVMAKKYLARKKAGK